MNLGINIKYMKGCLFTAYYSQFNGKLSYDEVYLFGECNSDKTYIMTIFMLNV